MGSLSSLPKDVDVIELGFQGDSLLVLEIENVEFAKLLRRNGAPCFKRMICKYQGEEVYMGAEQKGRVVENFWDRPLNPISRRY